MPTQPRSLFRGQPKPDEKEGALRITNASPPNARHHESSPLLAEWLRAEFERLGSDLLEPGVTYRSTESTLNPTTQSLFDVLPPHVQEKISAFPVEVQQAFFDVVLTSLYSNDDPNLEPFPEALVDTVDSVVDEAIDHFRIPVSKQKKQVISDIEGPLFPELPRRVQRHLSVLPTDDLQRFLNAALFSAITHQELTLDQVPDSIIVALRDQTLPYQSVIVVIRTAATLVRQVANQDPPKQSPLPDELEALLDEEILSIDDLHKFAHLQRAHQTTIPWEELPITLQVLWFADEQKFIELTGSLKQAYNALDALLPPKIEQIAIQEATASNDMTDALKQLPKPPVPMCGICGVGGGEEVGYDDMDFGDLSSDGGLC